MYYLPNPLKRTSTTPGGHGLNTMFYPILIFEDFVDISVSTKFLLPTLVEISWLQCINMFNEWAWCSIRITQLQISSHFVGQKKNEINRVTLISQHSNEVLRMRNS